MSMLSCASRLQLQPSLCAIKYGKSEASTLLGNSVHFRVSAAAAALHSYTWKKCPAKNKRSPLVCMLSCMSCLQLLPPLCTVKHGKSVAAGKKSPMVGMLSCMSRLQLCSVALQGVEAVEKLWPAGKQRAFQGVSCSRCSAQSCLERMLC